MYLECRLTGPAHRTDLIVRVGPEGRDILAGLNPVLHPDPAIHADPRWARLAALCREWADPGSPLFREVAALWLEFDLPAGDDTALPPPGVFVEWTELLRPRGAGEYERLARAALRPLFTDGVPPAILATLRRCLGELPAGAALPYVGLLLPRGEHQLRLCLAGLDRHALPRYLRGVEWPGPPAPLRRAMGELARFRPGAPRHSPGLVHLDVGGTVLPVVGLEYPCSRPEQMRGRIAEAAFLDHLVEAGLCDPGRRAALEGWPGYAPHRFGHQLWESLVRRRINHAKITLDDEGQLSAKIYLVVEHGFHPAQSRARA
jgi:hypothetical protein